VPYANLTNPQTLDLYMMASDDPETFADLDGHCGQQDGGCPNVAVKADSDPHVMTNVKLDSKTTRTGVGSTMTITITDSQGKPIPGALVKESPSTQNNLDPNKAAAQVANSKAVATDNNGAISDVVMQTVTDKQIDPTQASVVGQVAAGQPVDKTVTQNLTITTTANGQTCTCQATYQEHLGNTDSNGNLNPMNASGTNFSPIAPSKPVVTPVAKKEPQNP